MPSRRTHELLASVTLRCYLPTDETNCFNSEVERVVASSISLFSVMTSLCFKGAEITFGILYVMFHRSVLLTSLLGWLCKRWFHMSEFVWRNRVVISARTPQTLTQLLRARYYVVTHFTKLYPHGLWSVSYTHLDVYKRQIYIYK